MIVERILGEDSARDLFYASAMTGLMTEKQAEDLLDGLVKQAQRRGGGGGLNIGGRILDLVQRGILGAGGLAADAVAKIPSALGHTALLGAGLGALGALGFDAVKENLSQEDPEAKFNIDLEALYNAKSMEAEDAKWMAKVRSMRDELKRGWKKMAPEEYESKYNALLGALKEKMEA